MPRERITISIDDKRPLEVFAKCSFDHALKKEIDALRKRHNIDPAKYSNPIDREVIIEYLNFTFNKDLEKDLKKVIKKLKLPSDYFWHIHGYILTNKVGSTDTLAQDQQGVVVELDPNNFDQITIHVGSHATGSEIRQAGDFIRAIRNKAPRRKSKENFNRDLEMFLMAKAGYSAPEIDRYFKKRYGTDIGDYGAVAKVVYEQYDKFNIPKEHRKPFKQKLF